MGHYHRWIKLISNSRKLQRFKTLCSFHQTGKTLRSDTEIHERDVSSSKSINMSKTSTIASNHPSRCPDNTAFKQQRLPAWTLQLTPAAVLSSFFVVGLFCLAVGIPLTLAAASIKEIQINYSEECSHCSKLRENSSNWAQECQCFTNFTLWESMQGDVFMYYGLHNFYQNHRRYVHSRSDAQLLGRKVNIQKSNCAPFAAYNDGTPMAPCGAIANSVFNGLAALGVPCQFARTCACLRDKETLPASQLMGGIFVSTNEDINCCRTDTIHLFFYPNSAAVIQVPLLKQGITWWTDKNVKFQNPASQNLTSAFTGTAKPPYWQKPVYLLDEEVEENNGYKNEDFIIWMRVAAFPTFKNLYRRLRRTEEFSDGLPAGTYGLQISYNFPVSKFSGRKRVIFSTVGWNGGGNPFLGIAYTVTGAVTLLAGCIITAVHLKFGKRKIK